MLGSNRETSLISTLGKASFLYVYKGHQRVKQGTYFDVDGEPLARLSLNLTVLSTVSNVQLPRYEDRFEHPFKLHGLSFGRNSAEFAFDLLTWLPGAPGYGRPPAFGGFPGGSAPPGMGAPPGTGRPQSLGLDAVR